MPVEVTDAQQGDIGVLPRGSSSWQGHVFFINRIQGQWVTAQEGAGSGLDADLLDGNQASAFALLSWATFAGPVKAPNFVSSSDARLKSDIAPTACALAKVYRPRRRDTESHPD